MTNIAINIQGQILTVVPDSPLISRSVGEVTCAVTLDDSWAGYTVTLVFAADKVQKSALVPGSGVLTVPWEVLDCPGYLRISAVGHAPGKRRPTAHMRQPLVVAANGRIDGGPPGEYTPALWEQVMAKLDGMGTGGGGSSAGAEAAQAKAEAAQKKAEAAQAAAETAAQTAAGEATKAAEEASNAAQATETAAEAQRAAQTAQAKAGEAKQAAEKAREDAEAAKGAAEAILESIPMPKPTGADDGKVPVARGGAYQLEEIAVGGSGGELEYIGEYTLAEDVGVWEITSDLSGVPLQLKRMYFELDIKPAQINIDNNISNTHARMTVPTWTNAYGVNTCVSDYPMLRKTAYKENPGWGQLWEIWTLNGHDIVFRRSKGASCTATVSAGEAVGPGYITGLGLSSLDPAKAQFGAGSAIKIWGEKV